MSRVRGGVNSTSIRISNTPVKAYVDRIDYLIPLNEDAIPHLKSRINPETEIFGERKFFESVEECQNCNFIEIPFAQLAKDLGGAIYENIIAFGVICGHFRNGFHHFT